jgi:hypothetical protein
MPERRDAGPVGYICATGLVPAWAGRMSHLPSGCGRVVNVGDPTGSSSRCSWVA